tara:strand:+ start:2790 stop:3974 length:1185 start_codon:yes stop_codon:yes gene_type:complete
LKTKSTIKLFAINIFLIFTGILACSEIYIRIARPKLPMDVVGDSYNQRLKKAKKDSLSNQPLKLVVGDSFAHHEIGTDGNFFDSVFNCSDENICNYNNLAQSGEGLDFYLNSIQSVLENRNKSNPTKVIISIYFGNDIKVINSFANNNTCKSIHQFDEKIFLKLEDDFVKSIKRKFPSLLFITRLIKAYSYVPTKTNIDTILANARQLRINRIDEISIEIEDLASRIDSDIIKSAQRDIINPWELSLAIANPYFYDELYYLKALWAKRALNCLLDSLIVNIQYLRENNPNLEFLVIGIPDKFYWTQSSYPYAIKEYERLGYKFSSIERKVKDNPLSILFAKKLKYNKIPYIYIPELISDKINIIDWFYLRDMHINTKGNKEIAKLLKKKIFNKK